MGQDRWYEENGRALCTSLECTHRYESDCGVKCHEMEGEVERYEQEPISTLGGQLESEELRARRGGLQFGKPQPAFPREDRAFHEHPLLPGQAGAVIPKQGAADIVWSPATKQWRLYVTAPGVPYLVIDVTEQIKAIIEAQQEFDDKDRS